MSHMCNSGHVSNRNGQATFQRQSPLRLLRSFDCATATAGDFPCRHLFLLVRSTRTPEHGYGRLLHISGLQLTCNDGLTGMFGFHGFISLMLVHQVCMSPYLLLCLIGPCWFTLCQFITLPNPSPMELWILRHDINQSRAL